MTSIRSRSFSQPTRLVDRGGAVWGFLAAMVLLLATGASASATNLLYVSLDSSRIVTYDVEGSDGTAIAATRTLFTTTSGVPYGIAFDRSGTLFASIAFSNIISRYDAAGTHLSDISSLSLVQPNGLAFDRQGNLYAANTAGNTISKFDASGTFLATIGSVATLSQPYGVAVDASGFLYASSGLRTTSFISAFDPSGAYSADHSIGGDHLDAPIGMVFDNAGNLRVANHNASTLSTYSPAGAFTGTISGNLSLPYGLAKDREGNLYAMNYGNVSISKFDPSGTFITSWALGPGGSPIWGTFEFVSVPEIDPASCGSVLSLLLGCLGLLEWRGRSTGRS
jgi:sugar lactone lactonase YvrE